MTTPLPKYLWQVVGSDLFEINSEHYLIVVDYFSRYPEVIRLSTTISNTVITSLKAMFSRRGIPEALRTDNGSQYNSQRFSEFTKDYGITHTTSSPGTNKVIVKRNALYKLSHNYLSNLLLLIHTGHF